ncbi:hypothetical protein F2P81_006231 [Scophthalmus maximus]|uniref:BET1-like protein n=2 Tax=Scophthalmus maximus TaxID=52904 RepID=A0A6A4T2P8_SCOMX|nr:hypothetical protein F2P81_006231 [Scophthalmus maximus]
MLGFLFKPVTLNCDFLALARQNPTWVGKMNNHQKKTITMAISWRSRVSTKRRLSTADRDVTLSNMAEWNRAHGSVDDLLDVENKRLAENLAAKVSRLKSLAYDVDREAEDQNEYLDNMDSNFLSVTGLLSGSVKRFSTMVRSSRDNRRILCYVSGGLVLGFFLLYYLVSRIQR